MPRCGRPARRAVSRRARANEKNPALSVDRKPLGTSKRASHPARPVPAVAPHGPRCSADACRSAIGRPILCGHPAELRLERGVEPRMPVAVDVAPHARRAVEVAAPLGVDEPRANAAIDEQRLVFLHLRERVPDVLAIPLAQQIRGQRRGEAGCGRAASSSARGRGRKGHAGSVAGRHQTHRAARRHAGRCRAARWNRGECGVSRVRLGVCAAATRRRRASPRPRRRGPRSRAREWVRLVAASTRRMPLWCSQYQSASG